MMSAWRHWRARRLTAKLNREIQTPVRVLMRGGWEWR